MSPRSSLRSSPTPVGAFVPVSPPPAARPRGGPLPGTPPVPPRGAGPRLRVGLYGGSFTPAHEGHRHVAGLALGRLRLDQVWWLVSPGNPLKPTAGMAPLDRRVAEAGRVARHPRFRVGDLEGPLGTRYTVDTVRRLKRRFPRCRFVWLIGADNLRQMPRWRDWVGLARTLPIAVFDRPTYAFKALAGKAAKRLARFRRPDRAAAGLAGRRAPAWVFLHTPRHPASASAIRARRHGR